MSRAMKPDMKREGGSDSKSNTRRGTGRQRPRGEGATCKTTTDIEDDLGGGRWEEGGGRREVEARSSAQWPTKVDAHGDSRIQGGVEGGGGRGQTACCRPGRGGGHRRSRCCACAPPERRTHTHRFERLSSHAQSLGCGEGVFVMTCSHSSRSLTRHELVTNTDSSCTLARQAR
eukprot:3430883-Rhodomonas_salina.1